MLPRGIPSSALLAAYANLYGIGHSLDGEELTSRFLDPACPLLKFVKQYACKISKSCSLAEAAIKPCDQNTPRSGDISGQPGSQ